jgi:glycosyltransferase involved in cell wall biosynthesis
MYKKNLIWIGRLDDDKNFDLFIQICLILKHKFIKAIIYGDGKGKSDPRLDNSFFDIKGYVSNPWDKVSSNDIFIMTSLSECRPLALKEAVNCNLNIVVGNLEVGLKELCSGYRKLYISKSWHLLDYVAAVEKAALGIEPNSITWHCNLQKVKIQEIGLV